MTRLPSHRSRPPERNTHDKDQTKPVLQGPSHTESILIDSLFFSFGHDSFVLDNDISHKRIDRRAGRGFEVEKDGIE